MHLVTLDFETFWSQTHSLSKMSPILYVMHPETEIISCAVKVNDEQSVVVFGEDEVHRALVDAQVGKALGIAHNMSMFDSMILAWRLKLAPRMWGCTLAMARPHHERTIGVGLGKLVKHYGRGVKDNKALLATKGKHLRDFTPQELADMRVYNRDDTDQCRAIFGDLRPLTNNNEMWTIDSNIRMLVEDEFVVHQPMLRVALAREQAKKRKTLLRLAELLDVASEPGAANEDAVAEAVKTELMSAPKFSALLRRLDVEVPMKPSPKDADKMIPALAKSDQEFAALLEHEDEIVAAAAAARLEMKSTLLETRIQSFLDTAQARGGKLPIPAKYAGAHTYRDSGELYNALNLPRIIWRKDDTPSPKLTNALRMSILAPEGKLVGVADQAGIELRVNHTLWKVARTMKLWAADPRADIYKDTAARYYKVDLAEVEGPQRQFGKVLELACGFQVGPAKFKEFARNFTPPIILTLDQAQEGVWGWRNLTPEIAGQGGGWARCQEALSYIEAGQRYYIDPWGLTYTSKQGVHLPDGNIIRYPNLRRQVNEKTGRVEWKYGDGRHTKYLYGGKMDENIVQALARIVLMDNVREFWRRTGMHAKLRVYDEAVYLFTKDDAPQLLAELLSIMRTPPAWWPQLITWSEGDLAVSYGLAK